MKNLLLIFLIFFTFPLIAQNNTDLAVIKTKTAIREMDKGNIETALKLLKEADELDPGRYVYPYEMALAYYMDKQYAKAAKIFKKLCKHPEAEGRSYQMLGNCYDLLGDTKKAVKTYDKGLKLFPETGILYLERGNIEMRKKEYNQALIYYETGIERDPAFPSNYYWASKIYLSSSEEVWGMIYGEIFINLERGSGRTEEISRALYQTYKSEIKVKSDTEVSVDFSQVMVMSAEDLMDPEKRKPPFQLIYATDLSLAIPMLPKIPEINLVTMNTIRTGFSENFYRMEHDKKYPNILFDYQQKMRDAGHFETYNYWLLSQGEPETFQEWNEENNEKWEAFVKWFEANPLDLDEKHKFFRLQYLR